MKKQELQPIILIGAGRSGTKFLRSLISASEYIAEIPYDVGYVWRYGNESVPHDELTTSMLNESIKRYIRKTLPKLIDKETRTSKTKFFVEKSVPNTLRVEFLKENFPEAKFIHLIRDGRAVTESSIRMWKTPPERGYLLKKLKYFPWSNYKYATWYFLNIMKGKLTKQRGQGIWGPRYKGMEEDLLEFPLETVCARQWRKCIELANNQFKTVPPQNILEVRYEDLMSSSDSLKKICDFIQIPDCVKIIEKHQKTLRTENFDKWRSSLSTEQLGLINDEISAINKEHGYS